MNETPTIHKPGASFNYYRGDIYWNNFEVINCHLNKQISGDPEIGWQQHLKSCCGSFGRAFFPSCGNGWVERELFGKGVIDNVVGIDIGADMIDTATKAAADAGINAQYMVGDINTIDLAAGDYDLVVNHAAMHHVAYVNRVTQQIARALKTGGVYVGYDYVGPHRNQYPWEAWSAMVELNATLPERFQGKLVYPHMKTMLHTDPTEAIHSELIVNIMKRYFDLVQYSVLGGSVAYQMLYQNRNLYDERHTAEGREILDRIISADVEMLKAVPESNLFSFWIAKPKKTASPNQHQIEAWQVAENAREEAAKSVQGRYYPVGALEIIYNEMSDRSL